MNLPGFGWHPRKGLRKGTYAVEVPGNRRLIFRFDGADASADASARRAAADLGGELACDAGRGGSLESSAACGAGQAATARAHRGSGLTMGLRYGRPRPAAQDRRHSRVRAVLYRVASVRASRRDGGEAAVAPLAEHRPDHVTGIAGRAGADRLGRERALRRPPLGPGKLVGATRFELATPCTPCKCATRLRHAPTVGGMITEKPARFRHPRATSPRGVRG